LLERGKKLYDDFHKGIISDIHGARKTCRSVMM
jgi:hypothetical protein